ncbi:hypothetical protein [uncultured Clostridium sp.]|jgi:hypothetical protein|uniref:hypothetical protein n=1 Tax=uncultured Clostridium sp. TaxID=59620 RepID=UPI0026389331|nr:hypothetical protein [uncultured Clostridium sp.]
MADIQSQLNKINTAIYGKEVRGALVNGLNLINEETDKATGLLNKWFNTNSSQYSGMDVINIMQNITMMKYFINGSVNILNYKKESDTTYDAALSLALKSGQRIYFPTGIYNFAKSKYNLLEGNILFGDGTYKTIIKFVGDQNLDEKNYLFKTTNKSGIQNLQIAFENDFAGSAIYLESNNSNESRRFFTLNNIFVNFPFASGYGTGLYIEVKNYDENGNTYTDNRSMGLVYLHLDNLEVAYAGKGVSINLSQKDSVLAQCWITENIYSNCNLNSCLFGLYFDTNNLSNIALSDFNIKLSKVSIQLQKAGFFKSSKNMATAMYLCGESKTEIIKNPAKLIVSGSEVSIWDSETGENGIVENCILTLTDLFYSRVINNDKNYYGFSHTDSNSQISINGDTSFKNHTCFTTGKALEVTNIDSGKMYRYDTENNGWNCKTDITYNRVKDDQVYNVINQDNNGKKSTVIQSMTNNLETRSYGDDLSTFLSNDVSLIYHDFTVNVNQGIEVYKVDLTKFNINSKNPIIVGINRIAGTGDSNKITILSSISSNTTLFLKLQNESSSTVSSEYGVTLLCYKNY